LQQLAVKDFLQRMWSAHASKIETQNYQALKDLLELSAQQTRQAPAALTALVAMTPTRIDDYLKTQTSIPSGNTSQRWKTGLIAGAGALFFWKLLMRKKRG
jgi:hypothetical protein